MKNVYFIQADSMVLGSSQGPRRTYHTCERQHGLRKNKCDTEKNTLIKKGSTKIVTIKKQNTPLSTMDRKNNGIVFVPVVVEIKFNRLQFDNKSLWKNIKYVSIYLLYPIKPFSLKKCTIKWNFCFGRLFVVDPIRFVLFFVCCPTFCFFWISCTPVELNISRSEESFQELNKFFFKIPVQMTFLRALPFFFRLIPGGWNQTWVGTNKVPLIEVRQLCEHTILIRLSNAED